MANRLFKVSALIVVFSLALARPALAYIDPNTGGMLFQILAVFLASASALLLIFSRQVRMLFARLMRFFRARLGKAPATNAESPAPGDPAQPSKTPLQ